MAAFSELCSKRQLQACARFGWQCDYPAAERKDSENAQATRSLALQERVMETDLPGEGDQMRGHDIASARVDARCRDGRDARRLRLLVIPLRPLPKQQSQ